MIKYYPRDETMRLISSGDYNYIRLGDGEFRILCGYKCATPFQPIVPELKSKLEEIVKEANEHKYKNLIISISQLQYKKPWYLDYMLENMDCEQTYHDFIGTAGTLRNYLKNKNVVYITSQLSNSEIVVKDDDNKFDLLSNIDFINILDVKDVKHPDVIRIKKLMKISENWSLDFIHYYDNLEPEIKNKIRSRKSYYCDNNIRYDMIRFMDSINKLKDKDKTEHYFKRVRVKNVEYIDTYFRCSFEQYDYILNSLLAYDESWIFLFSTGPAGKIIAMDLIKRGVKNRIYDYGQRI